MSGNEIEPVGTYRPQYRLRWRGLVRLLDRFPRVKARLADLVRRVLTKVFDPGIVTTERVVEYPFVYQNLIGLTGPILDIGCVHSRLPIALASRGYRVVGIDFLPYPYRHPNLKAVRGDAAHAPFRATSFDAVMAISVIEHIGIGHYGDPNAEGGDREAVREVARILKPGGRSVITLPFGRPLTDDSKRVYDTPRLQWLLAPLRLLHVEYAWSRHGLWMPCTQAEAAMVDWNGPNRAVVLVVATRPEEPAA
jgi:SAM-dependent methyltransferase